MVIHTGTETKWSPYCWWHFQTHFLELNLFYCESISLRFNSMCPIMKYADVSSCFKKEDNFFKGNYRPVSVLTVIYKLNESVLNNQMVGHYRELFNILLSAFRKHYNCQSLLLKLIEDIKSALDKGHKTGAVFMDLSKAFDCLPHALLLAKLNVYGLSTAACELMSSYLDQRMQRVKISYCRSSWKILNKGVPQGSILGALLFNVFMHEEV